MINIRSIYHIHLLQNKWSYCVLLIVVMFIDSSDKYDIQVKHNNTI